jgi:hypothetical protein
VTPSKKSQRHSVIYNGTLTNINALPSSILQQEPQIALSRSRTPTVNPALTTSLQSLSLENKPSHSNEGALTDDEGTLSNTIRRSWNSPIGNVKQHYRLTHSPSPYDSASLILNNATSNANRHRATVYSMSDDESSRVWYPLSGAVRDEVG